MHTRQLRTKNGSDLTGVHGWPFVAGVDNPPAGPGRPSAGSGRLPPRLGTIRQRSGDVLGLALEGGASWSTSGCGASSPEFSRLSPSCFSAGGAQASSPVTVRLRPRIEPTSAHRSSREPWEGRFSCARPMPLPLRSSSTHMSRVPWTERRSSLRAASARLCPSPRSASRAIARTWGRVSSFSTLVAVLPTRMLGIIHSSSEAKMRERGTMVDASSSCAVLSCDGPYTSFSFGGYDIRF